MKKQTPIDAKLFRNELDHFNKIREEKQLHSDKQVVMYLMYFYDDAKWKQPEKANKPNLGFKQSEVDGSWICLNCGEAVYPTPENINEHIGECNGKR